MSVWPRSEEHKEDTGQAVIVQTAMFSCTTQSLATCTQPVWVSLACFQLGNLTIVSPTGWLGRVTRKKWVGLASPRLGPLAPSGLGCR